MIFKHQISKKKKKTHLVLVEMPTKGCLHTLPVKVCPTEGLKQLNLA